VDSITYVICTFLVGYVSEKLSKRVFISVSFVGCIISLILMGPSYYLGLPNQLWILIVGMGLQGASLGFIFIPILPEMIECLYDKHRLIEGQDERIDAVISDKAAGLYGSFYSIGMIISPLLGSAIFDAIEEHDQKFAFNKTCDMFALFTAIFTLFYFVFNVLPDYYSCRKNAAEHYK
jgi:MFS family permease